MSGASIVVRMDAFMEFQLWANHGKVDTLCAAPLTVGASVFLSGRAKRGGRVTQCEEVHSNTGTLKGYRITIQAEEVPGEAETGER